MLKIKLPVLILVFIFTTVQDLVSQKETLQRIFLDLPTDSLFISLDTSGTSIKLPYWFIVPSSEKLFLGTFKLSPGIHYRMNYSQGTIQLLQKIESKYPLRVYFRRYPFPLIPEYYRRELQVVSQADSDSTSQESIIREAKPKIFSEIEAYQVNLRKSGSIVRGVEIGSNQDLTLNSGLNLQISGFITPEVELVAALTDESTPIQPEGNTQTLREVDKVFVKIKSPYLGGTLGDFNLKFGFTRYGSLQRKLQGISVENRYRRTLQQVTYGSSRGTFHSLQFLGQEGKQGPYRLTGRNGERDIIVLAGTERVYVNGQLQSRGENNDYVIDYSLAEITFTNKKLITSESRIEVDFEYANAFQRYGKNFLGVSSRAEEIAGRFTYDVRFFREWDDTKNLLEDSAPLTEEEKLALEQAGDEPLKSSVSGVRLVGQGKGTYVKADTVLNDSTFTFYRYVGSGRGDYSVRFTSVGRGRGDYRRVRLGVYEYVGPGGGDYLPIRLVPLAGDKKFTDIYLGYKVTNHLSLKGEVALSQFDRNVFSNLGDGDNFGNAFQVTSTFQDSAIHVGGKSFGKLLFTTRWVRQSGHFSPLDRQFHPEYAYKWNLSAAALSIEENSFETELRYQPTRSFQFNGGLGRITKGPEFSSLRRYAEWRVSKTFLPDLQIGIENISSSSSGLQSNWLRQNFSATKQFWKIIPTLDLKREDRTVENSTSKVTGFTFEEGKGRLQLKSLLGIDWLFETQLRLDYLYNPNGPRQRLKQATTTTYKIQGIIQPTTHWQGRFSMVYRDKDFAPFFESLPADSIPEFQADALFQDTTWQDRQSHLANIELQYRNRSGSLVSKLDYKVVNELQALREKVFLEVGENRGNYRFDESLGEYVPDPQGNFFLIILPTGKFQSITRLETAWRLRYRPKPARRTKSLWQKVWKNMSTLTYIKIEEESQEQDILQLYLLNLKRLHNLSTTLRGAFIINQDIFLFEGNPNWGIQLRSRYRDNLSNQFLNADNNESRIIWERNIQVRKRFWKNKLNFTASYKNSLNKRSVSTLPGRSRNIISQAFSTRINYRPKYAWQIQAEIEYGWEHDRATESKLRVNYWNFRPRVDYSIRGRARASANLTAIFVQITENPLGRVIPFEMGKGKKEGLSWLWNLRFEYFLSNNITITANYIGRKDATSLQTIHLGKAEVRAFF